MMESIEKLRGYKLCKPLDICIHYYDSGEIADEIEAEIAEKYMELPVDADGVPIHVGDKLTNINKPSDEYTVAGVNGEKLFVYGGHAFICASQCRHVKSRTVEDVLRAFYHDASDADAFCTVRLDDVLAKYAAELRGMMEADDD